MTPYECCVFQSQFLDLALDHNPSTPILQSWWISDVEIERFGCGTHQNFLYTIWWNNLHHLYHCCWRATSTYQQVKKVLIRIISRTKPGMHPLIHPVLSYASCLRKMPMINWTLWSTKQSLSSSKLCFPLVYWSSNFVCVR
jgi:hypothetical protein